MTVLGLDPAVVSELVTAATRRPVDPDEVDERFAGSAWTSIAEPGDRHAGALVGALGPVAALSAVIDRVPVDSLAAAMREAGGGGDALGSAELQEALDRWRPRLSSKTCLLALSQAARYDVRLLVPSDPLWPPGLSDLGPFGPLALWVRGTDAALASLEAGIALVGARAATGYGEHVTMEASAGLVDRGYAIVSGAAYGIDGMAHRAALASHGHTIAFLAGGLDRFYPSGHEELLTRIAANGAVISEVPCGTAPTKWRFLQRNRLIAASSQATIVLEAGWRSGSLNTAGHASALGRPLGAVPGPVTSAASAGCHRLIRDYDAVCVTNADEMAELAPLGTASVRADATSPDAGERARSEPSAELVRLFDALSTRSPRTTTDIAARAGLSISATQGMLGTLQLDGRVRESERGWTLIRTTESR